MFLTYGKLFIGLCIISYVESNDGMERIDPTDMFNYDSANKKMRLVRKLAEFGDTFDENDSTVAVYDESCCAQFRELKNKYDSCTKEMKNNLVMSNFNNFEHNRNLRPETEMPFMRRFVSVLLRKFTTGSSEEFQNFKVTIKMDTEARKRLEQFVDTSNKIPPQDVDEVLRDFFYNSFSSSEDENNRWYSVNFKEILVSSVACMVVYLIYKIITGSIFRALVLCIIGGLIVSGAWEWNKMYEEAKALRHAEVSKHGTLPAECKPKELGWWDWFMWKTASEDSCEKYYKLIMVDPFWDISPGEAMSRAFVKVITGPFGILGQNIGRFYMNLKNEAPTFVFWFLLPSSVIFVFVYLLVHNGYRLSLFGFALGPSEQNQLSLRERIEDLDRRNMNENRLLCGHETPQQHLNANTGTRAIENVGSREKEVTVDGQKEVDGGGVDQIAISQGDNGAVEVHVTLRPRKSASKFSLVSDVDSNEKTNSISEPASGKTLTDGTMECGDR